MPSTRLGLHDESRSRGAHIDPGDFVASRRSYGEFRTVGDPFYNPNLLTLSRTDCTRACARREPGAERSRCSMSRFGQVRRNHIKRIVRQGPTEIGYAYFRARRRRRNLADDESLLSEVRPAGDVGPPSMPTNELCGRTETWSTVAWPRRPAGAHRSVLWMLPYFNHVYFGGTHTLLRFADHFARVHGVATHFHCYDVGEPAGPPDNGDDVARAFPALSQARFTSGHTPVSSST